MKNNVVGAFWVVLFFVLALFGINDAFGFVATFWKSLVYYLLMFALYFAIFFLLIWLKHNEKK
jgi:hypothetical protein